MRRKNMRLTRRSALLSTGAISILGAACARRVDQEQEDGLGRIDAVETARRITDGEITALESIEAAIERAERVNPLINAIVTETYDAARERAAQEPGGPWWGVPSIMKDLTDVVGVPTGYGSRAFAGYVPEKQYPFVDRFFELGLISLGKSSSPEFGLTATTESLRDGATRNPWNLNHSVGGSSGGAAAVVAAGIVPVAHASDGGGSIRIPASCCGLVGLKTTRHMFPDAADLSEVALHLSVPGVVSRTVRDTAVFLSMMEAIDDKVGPRIGLVTGPNKERRKIGFYTDASMGYAVSPDVIEATRKVASRCEELGHEVVEIDPPFGGAGADDFMTYWSAGAHRAISNWEAMTGKKASYENFEPMTFGLASNFERNKDQIDDIIARLKSVEASFEAMEGFDVLLSPVVAAPPPELGYLSTDLPYEEAMDRLLPYASFTGMFNVAGAPSMSLPLSQSSAGLPIGAMFSAKKRNERILLEIAYELEEVYAWSKTSPRVYA